VKDYTNLIKVDRKNANYYANRGIAYIKIEDYHRAVGDFSSAIKINDKFAEAYYNRANAHAQLQDDIKACKDMKNAARNGYEPAYGYIEDVCGGQ